MAMGGVMSHLVASYLEIRVGRVNDLPLCASNRGFEEKTPFEAPMSPFFTQYLH
jgi:hypothetical protein